MSELEPEVARMRRVAFLAVVVSTLAVVASVVTLPMVYNYVQGLQTHMMQEMDFCKSRSRDLWIEVSMMNHPQPKVAPTRQRRDWLFGQWVAGGGNQQASGYGANPTPAPGGYDTPVVNSEPVVTPSCCTCHQGAAGPAGEPGADGENGKDGEAGAPGAPGQDGQLLAPVSKDEPGVICPPGPPGPMGSMGEAGPPGPAGPKGEDGAPGKKGEDGMAGAAGPVGRPGRDGAKGPPGEQGKVIVVPGPPGLKGKSGEKGPPGDIGPVGTNGKDGRAGQKGAPGDPGDQGTDGKKGGPGEKGPPGPSGDAGTCGHCPPPRLPPGY